jgi:neurofibromin 1
MKQDGLPMICIILRNIDTETTDYDLLLFSYLKVRSSKTIAHVHR